VIQEPLAQLAYLAGLVACVFQIAKLPVLAPLFDRLPALVWAFFLPMLSTTFGLLPADSLLYPSLTRYLLPGCLVLMLLASDLASIAKLGRMALLSMAAGCLGIALGASAGYLVLRPWLPPDAWKAAGALAATWTGGSANLLAVATTLQIDPGVVIIIDTVVGYSWMGFLIWLASRQTRLDAWNGANRSVVDAVSAKLADRQVARARPATVADLTLMMGLALGLTALAIRSSSARDACSPPSIPSMTTAARCRCSRGPSRTRSCGCIRRTRPPAGLPPAVAWRSPMRAAASKRSRA